MNDASTMKFLADLDARLYAKFSRLEERLKLYRIARVLSFTGDGYFYALIAVIAWVQVPASGQPLMMAGLLAFAIELPLYFLLKKLFKRRRPYHVVPSIGQIHRPSDEFSFPSGHTTAGFLVAFLVSHFFVWATIPMYIWATLIGISRVILRVHFVSDIIAGMALGSVIAILALKLIGQ